MHLQAVSRAKAQENAAARRSSAADDEAAAAEDEGGRRAYECVGGGRRRDCWHKGGRDPARDRRCDEEVPAGASGSCEGPRRRAEPQARNWCAASTCDHPPFTCADECARAAHYAWLGWRQRATARPTARARRTASRAGRTWADASDYCECGGGRRVRAARRQALDDDGRRDTIRCADECARGEATEVLGLAAGARVQDLERGIPAAEPELHPDKLRRSWARRGGGGRAAVCRGARARTTWCRIPTRACSTRWGTRRSRRRSST